MDGDTLVTHEVEVDHRPLVECSWKIGKPLLNAFQLRCYFGCYFSTWAGLTKKATPSPKTAFANY